MRAFTKCHKVLTGVLPVLLTLVLTKTVLAQDSTQHKKFTQIDVESFGDNSRHWYGIFDKKNVINPLPGRPRYSATQITEVADNILLFQKNNGGWPKNYDVMAILSQAQKDSVMAVKNIYNTTYDNGSTYTQVTCLAGVYSVTNVAKYKEGAIKGLQYILNSQYKNGGWPQYYPLESDYSRCITFNDGVFEGIMELLKDIKDNQPEYAFIDDKFRAKLNAAYDRGMDCIIKTQINDAGKPTAWCQQYDEVKLTPAWARKFEPPSICNGESADLVLFLMRIDNPKKEIIDAIQNAVVWFDQSKIYNTRVKTIPAPRLVTPFRVSTTDRVVVEDITAPPIWTRYYELKTHRPLFCNRDMIVVYSFDQVDRERRDGYGWYTYNPQKVLNKYSAWQQKWDPGKNVLAK
jgi:PelA/Pel-15E family pectate lyase